MTALTHHAGSTGKQKSAVLGRATGTVQHHSANAKATLISSPEQSVAE